MFENIDFTPGIVEYDDFQIKSDLLFEQQEFSFKEDLFQVAYEKNRFIVDIGWYPEFNPDGCFKMCIIHDLDWMNPLVTKKIRDLEKLEDQLRLCDKIVRELIEKNEDDFYIIHVENVFKIENRGIVIHGSNEGKICIGDKLKEIESGGIFRILGIDHFYCSNKEIRDEINKRPPILIETVENKEFFKDKVLIKV